MKVAIIITSYNSLGETTRPCVESILKAKGKTGYRIVLVDNCSTDGTRHYLESLAHQHDNVQIILNNSNLGFAAGNNVGIRAIDAEYYVLLNSDTIVTDYWLDGLIGFLESHPGAGMAGPVSNSVGNEQIIAAKSGKESEIIREGIEWTKHCQGDFFHTRMLGFFCLAVRRGVIDTIGLLDESFGIGMFEDDDYCYRVLEGGYKLACVEDVFIYHKGSISFKNANINNINELYYSNMKLFERKHSVKWQPRLAASSIIELIDIYVQNSQDDPEKALYKIANKLQILHNFDYSSQSVSADELAGKLADVYTSLTWKIGSGIIWVLEKLPFSDSVCRLLTRKTGGACGSRWS